MCIRDRQREGAEDLPFAAGEGVAGEEGVEDLPGAVFQDGSAPLC